MGNAQAAPAEPAMALEESRNCSEALHRYFSRSALPACDPLFAHVRARDVAALERAVSGRRGAAKVNVKDRQGFSPLHAAIHLGFLQGAVILVQAGADIDAFSDQQYTPLMLAAALGNLSAVQWLTERGASVNLRSRRGSTALHWAAQDDSAASKAILRHLLDAGAQATAHGYRNRSPLQLAVAAHGDVEVVSALLARGGDPGEPNPAMHSATPLHSAAHLGRVECMRVLLEAGANPDARSDPGFTPLLEIFRHSQSSSNLDESCKRQMARLLLDAGANINLVAPSGFGLLHYAFRGCRDEDSITMLLDGGLDASYQVDKPLAMLEPGCRTCCLHLAARRGWSQVVERLVRAGADIELKDAEGFAPLHLAIRSQSAAVVRTLLRLGANPHAHAPDIYPSYHRWKVGHSLQALQGMMQMQGMPNLAELFNLMWGQRGPTASAVDMAVSVTQHLPTVEAFIERGVRPSGKALVRGCRHTPILREVCERPMWTPALHARMPIRFKVAARQLLLCMKRAAVNDAGAPLDIPQEVLALILQKAAFPVTDWATGFWLLLQRTQDDMESKAEEEEPHLPPGVFPFPLGGGGGGGGGGGPPGMPAGLAAVMNQVMQALQQQILGGAQGGVIPLPPGVGAQLAQGLQGFGGGEGGEEDEEAGGGGDESDEEGGGQEDGAPPAPDAPHDPDVHFIQLQFHFPLAGPGLAAGPMVFGGPLPGGGPGGMPGMPPGFPFAVGGGGGGGAGPFPFPFPIFDDDQDEDEAEEMDEEEDEEPDMEGVYHDDVREPADAAPGAGGTGSAGSQQAQQPAQARSADVAGSQPPAAAAGSDASRGRRGGSAGAAAAQQDDEAGPSRAGGGKRGRSRSPSPRYNLRHKKPRGGN